MYVTVEGIDGSGTTTVSGRLVNALKADGVDAQLTAEPDDDAWTGRAVREALSRDTAHTTDLFLFLADRAEHLCSTVRPALERSEVVVSDRGHDSTYAYQRSRVEHLVDDTWQWFDDMYGPWNLEPDLTIYLDVPVGVAMDRASGDEKYEHEEMQREAQAQYDRLAERHSGRYVVVDADRPVDAVIADCVAVVRAAEDLPLSVDQQHTLAAMEATGRLPDGMEADA